LSDLRTAFNAKDVAAIDRAMEAINGAWSAASTEMYSNTGANNAQGGESHSGENNNTQGSTSKDDVTDVDYEEVKK
jgi:molecular chaperone DnaK